MTNENPPFGAVNMTPNWERKVLFAKSDWLNIISLYFSLYLKLYLRFGKSYFLLEMPTKNYENLFRPGRIQTIFQANFNLFFRLIQ